MAKEFSLIFKIFDNASKYSLYALIFLMPLFFLPWTAEAIDFNKQTLLIILVFISLFSWMLKTILAGKLEININFLHICVGIFLFVYSLSALFSVSKYGSFWGWPQITAESLLSVICLAIFYFLVSNIFSQREIFISLAVFSASVFLTELIGFFQLSSIFIFPFDFTKILSFNTVSSTVSLGIFAAVFFPLNFILLIMAKKWWKVFFAFQFLLSVLLLILLNYPIVWWTVIPSCVFIIVFGMFKKGIFDARWMYLPMFLLMLSLFFALLSPRISWFSQNINEIFLSQKYSFETSVKALSENPVLGSGPGTFAYDFLKYKSSDFNKNQLWNVTFVKAGSKVFNDLATTGILGLASFFLVSLACIFLGLKFITRDTYANKENGQILPALGFTAAIVSLFLSCFFYNSAFLLNFFYFFSIGAVALLISKQKKEYKIGSSSTASLVISFIFTLVFIFSSGILILHVQRYAAEVYYLKGVIALQENKKDQAIEKIKTAAKINSSSDLYFRQLSRIYLLKTQEEFLKDKEISSNQEKLNNVKVLIADTQNLAKIATDINPKNISNWLNRGYIFQGLSLYANDASVLALNAYDEALKLDPKNPYPLAQKGNVFLVSALKNQDGKKTENLTQAKTYLEKAASMVPDYYDAMYSLGFVYDALKERDKAIEIFTKLSNLNAGDENIKKILNNLKIGKSAIDTVSPLSENVINESYPQP